LVPLPDPLSQQFNQQSNKQIQNISGRVTPPPAAISSTPPDTRRPTLPRAPRFRRVRAHSIPASHLPVNALRPRSRPDYRIACATSRHHRRCSSVRSPAGVARRRHGGRPATRHPHCAGLLRCRCGRPAAVFTSPVWQPRRLPRARPRAHTRGACMRTPYRLRNRPATRRYGLILKSARVAGLAAGASRKLGGSRPHPDRYGHRRSFAAVASQRPAHRPPRRRLLACRMRTPPFSCPQCGSRRPSLIGCHIAGRGRRQPCRRGAVFARGYTPQPARPPPLLAAATPRPHSINVVCRAS